MRLSYFSTYDLIQVIALFVGSAGFAFFLAKRNMRVIGLGFAAATVAITLYIVHQTAFHETAEVSILGGWMMTYPSYYVAKNKNRFCWGWAVGTFYLGPIMFAVLLALQTLPVNPLEPSGNLISGQRSFHEGREAVEVVQSSSANMVAPAGAVGPQGQVRSYKPPQLSAGVRSVRILALISAIGFSAVFVLIALFLTHDGYLNLILLPAAVGPYAAAVILLWTTPESENVLLGCAATALGFVMTSPSVLANLWERDLYSPQLASLFALRLATIAASAVLAWKAIRAMRDLPEWDGWNLRATVAAIFWSLLFSSILWWGYFIITGQLE